MYSRCNCCSLRVVDLPDVLGFHEVPGTLFVAAVHTEPVTDVVDLFAEIVGHVAKERLRSS